MSHHKLPGRNVSAIICTVCALLFFCHGTSGILRAQVTVNTGAGNGNGMLMTEGGSPITTLSGFDSIFADSGNHRAKIINNGGSALVLATWPCTTVGCISYGSSLVSSIAPETALAGNVLSGTAMLTENSRLRFIWQRLLV